MITHTDRGGLRPARRVLVAGAVLAVLALGVPAVAAWCVVTIA